MITPAAMLSEMPICPGPNRLYPGRTQVLPRSKTASDQQQPRSTQVLVNIFRVVGEKKSNDLGRPNTTFCAQPPRSKIGKTPGHPGLPSSKAVCDLGRASKHLGSPANRTPAAYASNHRPGGRP